MGKLAWMLVTLLLTVFVTFLPWLDTSYRVGLGPELIVTREPELERK